MPLTLNEKEKRNIAATIQEKMQAHLSHFPFARYPTEPFQEWQRIFSDPKAVSLDTLKTALSWHFGSWQRKDMALSHRKIVTSIIKAWPEYVEHISQHAEQAITFWEGKLTDWQHGFGAAAFLLHLQRPDQFELADRHRLDAMLDLLKAIDHAEKDRKTTLSLADLQDMTTFFRAILPKMNYGNDSRTVLDRFLKSYGNRHAYKLLPDGYTTQEPAIRSFSWETVSSEQFNLNLIANRANADILFACFLLTLESSQKAASEFTIDEIVAKLPLGTAGICNPASFNYALISLFSGQKQRDFWLFDDPNIRVAFTAQANNSTRDMRFYLQHSDLKIKLNPKYVNAET